MLGLSIGTDSGVPKLGRNNHKSYEFASKNIGRFHTSGISGSMKKHTAKKMKADTDKVATDDQDEKLRKLKDRSKNYVPERLEARQREIEEDTMKLLALEKKLDEVKRQKEMKRKRELARQQQKLHYSSAVAIQRLVRRWLLKRYMFAATALQSFLKFAAAKQAVAAASWAISILRGFVHMIEEKQHLKRQRKEAARQAAMSTWLSVAQTSAASVAAARSQAVQLVAHSIQVGTRGVAMQKHHRQQHKQRQSLMKRAASLGSPKPKGSPSSHARAKKLWALLRSRVIPVHFKFHDPAWRRRTVFTDGYLNPATDPKHPHYAKVKVHMVEVVEEVEERRKRDKMAEVIRLHKQREEEMRQEKVLRLQMIAEQKRKKEQERNAREQEELLLQATKEKNKLEFLRRMEQEQSERAKVINQAREKKVKLRLEREAQLKEEIENEATENKLMYAEDIRFFQNLEKVRKQRLRDYAMKQKLAKEKTEKDFQPLPGPTQGASGYLSSRGGGGRGGEEMSERDLALEEERKMHIWAANDAAMKQRLAARREAEKKEKLNTALEQEMIRKEKELVAMKAQLLLKRAAFMKNKAKKLKEQAQENSDKQQQEGHTQDLGQGQGSSSARGTRSRGGSRKRTGGGGGGDRRTGSGSAPTTARDSPSKQKKQTKQQQQKQTVPYDVLDPLAMDSLQLPNPHRGGKDAPDEDWDWHTPRAVGSGKSAISDLRRSKYSPILHRQAAAGAGPLVSPGAVRLNSAERLAAACQRGGEYLDAAPNPFKYDENKHLKMYQQEQEQGQETDQNEPYKSFSAQDLLTASAQQQLPTSPIDTEHMESLQESLKLPSIALAHTASEGKMSSNNSSKMKHIAGKGLLKNKYIQSKLENSPYGSLLPKQQQGRQGQRPGTLEPSESTNIPYSTPHPQTVAAPTSTFTSLTRPSCPSLQGVSISTGTSVKKSVQGDSLMAIVEKAREKLKHDQDLRVSKDSTSAALIAATAALKEQQYHSGGDNSEEHVTGSATQKYQHHSPSPSPTKEKEKLKVKKKKKIKKKTVTPAPAHVPPPVAAQPNKEKVNKRKLINDTYTKIMKAEAQKKAAEKRREQEQEQEEEVPAELVADFFARRRQAAANDEDNSAAENIKDEGAGAATVNSASHAYWKAAVLGNDKDHDKNKTNDVSTYAAGLRLDQVTPQTAAAMGLINNPLLQVRKGNKGATSKSSKKAHLSGTDNLNEQSVADERDGGEEGREQEGQFYLDEQHLQLNSSPYEEHQVQQHQHQHLQPPEIFREELYADRKEEKQEQEQRDEDEEEDEYGDDEDFEDHDDSHQVGDALDSNNNNINNINMLDELSAEFRESDTFGDAYEDELNMECERLRAELERKMLAKFEL